MTFRGDEFLVLAGRIEARVAAARAERGRQEAAVHYHAANDEVPMVLAALRLAARCARCSRREPTGTDI